MAGHSASEDARERAYDPAIHLLRKNFSPRMMDHPKSGLPDLESVPAHGRSAAAPTQGHSAIAPGRVRGRGRQL